MSKIYIPSEYLNKPCVVVNNGYLRVYDTTYTNISNSITDIYINQDYMIKIGSANYNNNIQCVSKNLLTDEVYYRLDFPDILLMFVLFSIIFFAPGLKLFTRMFRRFR